MSRTFDIVQAMSGQKNVIVIPRPYLKFFRGEQQAHALGAVLNNLVFWSAFSNEKGWFYKTYEELGEEAGGLSKDQTERLVKKLIKNHLSTAIQTCVKKVNGTPTMHYKVDGDALISLIFNEDIESAKSRRPKREVTTSKPRSNEIETEESRNLGKGEVAESFLYTDVNTDVNIQTNKPSCQVAPQPDHAVDPNQAAFSVLEHLNRAAGMRFQKSKSSLGPIRGRLAEDFTAAELILTVDYSIAKWAEDAKMCEYVRPETIFRPGKFPGYLSSAQKWDIAGRPKCINGKWQRDVMAVSSTDYAIPEGFRGA